MLLVFLTCGTTLFSILTLDKIQKARIFALWFFHNSIRFKVNKVWLGLVVRQALIVLGRLYSENNLDIVLKYSIVNLFFGINYVGNKKYFLIFVKT